MSNIVLAEIFVPVVVAIALTVWITMVYRADKYPTYSGPRRGSKPRREVIGGSFRGHGGRQLMPLPGHPPATDDDHEVPGDAEYQEGGS